ncbi:FHA domain-containing protein [Streptomyces sp. NA04227]|uniref:FHA domain-containing protein n=1 Tax=Streptomyces sp. NA04227 TaxID=2742136 RepID=UPI00158FDF85|nr:FHA domain-containing protein [Streptomyces sp. NA04227]QKW06811.1 FHA domain-containing protein [Streptomyces sp. NA04227]
MQIRLTVLGPRSDVPGQERNGDVLVTAPAGTALAAVAPALVTAVAGGEAQPVLYAGGRRLDPQRATLGEPPLTDGAVLHLGSPGAQGPDLADGAAQLHVVAGPDAGGVHLLHGGQILIGRSAEADVPLDDPDVSRLHCAITVAQGGRITVTDLGSTNGTEVDGAPLGSEPVPLAPGTLLRLGESTLRLAPAGGLDAVLHTAPDGEGHLRVTSAVGGTPSAGSSGSAVNSRDGQGTSEQLPGAAVPHPAASAGSAGRIPQARTPADDGTWAGPTPPAPPLGPPVRSGPGAPGESGPTRHQYGDSVWDSSGDDGGAAGFGRAPQGGNGQRGAALPKGGRRRGLAAFARKLTGGGGRGDTPAEDFAYAPEEPRGARERTGPEVCPDPAALLLTALGPGTRLWERGAGHPEALTVRLGLAEAPVGGGGRPVPLTVGLRQAGSLGLAGPRERLTGLARSVLAQLAALHTPDQLEIVLLSTNRAAPQGTSGQERTPAPSGGADWSWLGWLPHVRPGNGQDCRLLLAYDREQAAARTGELLRRLDDRLADEARTPDVPAAPSVLGSGSSVLVVDGDPGSATLRAAVTRLAAEGAAAGIHVLCLASVPAAQAGTSWEAMYEQARGLSPAFDVCGATALLTGDVATTLQLRYAGRESAASARPRGSDHGSRDHLSGDLLPGDPQSLVSQSLDPQSLDPQAPDAQSLDTRSWDARSLDARSLDAQSPDAQPLDTQPPNPQSLDHRSRVPHPPLTGTVDAVSPAWAERFARALAPLRTDSAGGGRPRVSAPLPQTARLLDELGLQRATPASLLARWASAADDTASPGGRALAVLGAGPRGPVPLDLVAEGPHAVIAGPAGSGRSELLRAVAASLAAAERPDRLAVVLVDGRDGTAAPARGEGLRACTDLPHVTTHLTANDPVRMREFAQALTAELKRRAELLGRTDFAEWHTGGGTDGSAPTPVPAPGAGAPVGSGPGTRVPSPRQGQGATGAGGASSAGSTSGAGEDLDAPPSTTLRLRPPARESRPDPGPPLPRLVVLVDDVDVLLAPPLGSPGRPAAGSVVRALEAVARDGARLGVHLVAVCAAQLPDWAPVVEAPVRVLLEAPAEGAEDPAPGRGRLLGRDGAATPVQSGRVTGRIPRTATLRPTVVPLEWERMGDPPTRRPVRELGNGPTDLALLASALERAARSVDADRVPSLL